MAKCIRGNVGQWRAPVRMSDEDAFQVVERDHGGAYCSKSFFKKWYSPSAEFPDKVVEDPLRARLVSGKITKVDTLARELQHSRR